MRLTSGDRSVEVRIQNGVAVVDGRPVDFRTFASGEDLDAIEIGGEIVRVRAAESGDAVLVWCRGSVVRIARAERGSARPDTAGDLLSPMPGKLARVLIPIGEDVGRGQPILVLEAMKMEHVIRSPREGKLGRLFFQEGDLVEAGAVLAEIE